MTPQHTIISTSKATTVTPQHTTIPTHKATTVTPQHTTIPTPKATTVTLQHTTIPTHKATTVTPQQTTIPTHKATTVTPQHTTIPTPKATTVTPQHTTIPTHRATTVTPQHTTIPTHKATTLTPQHTTILTHKATTVTPQHSTMPVVETTTTTETATTPPHTTNKHTTPRLTTVINGSTKQHEAATPALTTSQQTASTKRTIPHGGGDTTVQTAEGQVTSITATPEKIKTVSYSSIEVTLTQSKETTAIGSTTPEHGGPTTVVIETTSVNGHTEPSIGPQLTTVAKETTTVDGHTEPPVVTDPPIVRTTEHQLETTTAPPTTMTKDLGIQTTTNQVTTQRPAPTTAQVTIPSRRSSIRKTTSVLMETTQGVTQHPGSTVPPATNLATQRSTTTPNKEFTDTDQPTTISQQSPTIPKVPTHATFWTSPRASPRDVTTQKSRGSTKDFTMTDFMMTRPSPDLYCEAATVRDIYWPVTMTGDTAKQFCPEGTTGKIENISSVSDVAIVTSLMVNSTDPDQVMYGGDVIGSVNNINSLNKIIAEQSGIDEEYMLEFIDKVAMALTEVGSNLLDHTVAWNDIPGEKRVQTATQLLQCMDETGFLLVNLMKAGQNISVVNENILMEVLVKDMNDTDKAGIKFPFKGDLVHSSSADEKIKSTIGSIALSEKTLQDKSVNGTVKLVFFMYSTMGDILGTGSDIGNENDTADSIVNSPIISASINKMNSPSYLSEPAVLVFEHKQTYNVTDAVCSYWNFTPSNDGIWSDYGCETVTNNDTHTVCKCSHLTNFAVIMDVRGVAISPDHHFALSVITYAGFIVSMVCLLLCLFTFCCCSSLQNDRNTIHKNLCLCLLIAEVIFMAGIDQTDQEVWCSVIAGFLHYFFLAAFAWMSLEGIQLYVMLVEVFEAEHSRRRYYYPYGYGVPAVIVGVSAAVYYDGYGTDQYCWITTERGLIWAFVGPVCAVILVNMIFLVMAAVIMCRHSGSAPGKKQTGTWIKAACVLLCLLGITWIFGLMYINTHTLVMAYVFTIANSLQGLFIFVFHCCLNEKVKKAYRSSIRDSHCCPECIRVRYTSSAYSNQAHGSSVASSKKIRKSSNASCPSSTGKRNSSSVTHNLLGSNGTHNLHNGVGLQNVQVRVKLPRQDRATQTDNRIKKQNIIEKKLQEIVDLKFKLPPLEMKRTTSDSCLVSPTPNVQTSFTFEQSISNTSVDKFLSDDSNVHSSMPNLTIRKPKENKTKERDLAQVEWKLSRNQSLPDLLELEVINPAMTGYRRCGSECNIHTGNKERYDLSGRRDSSLPIKVLHTKIADKNGQPWSRISISPLLIRKSISDTKMIEETSINLNSNLFGSPNKSTVDDDNQVMLKKWRTDEDIAVSETPVYTSQDSEQTPDVEVKGIHTNSKYYESYL
uniref:Latrophilin-2-like n=1 Tax=Saccoglossus kowalevskii TaxID=10224 RepID=A0ABM0M2W9_SACKO|nr:PREDICTED: latrophilin-2-like [Saccoglossus kowalevskii]